MVSDDTPVRLNTRNKTTNLKQNVAIKRSTKRQAISSPPQSSSDSVSLACIKDTISEVVKLEMQNLSSEINKNLANMIAKEFRSIKEEIIEMKESMQFLNCQYEDIRKKVDTTSETIKKLQDENINLTLNLKTLTNKINIIEQHNRASNLEIQCVPESRNENLDTLIQNLTSAINCNLNRDYILHCTRIAKLDPHNSRPRSIILQLDSPKTRDMILSSVIKYNKTNPNNKLNTCHMGIAGEKKPVFVSEHLSAANKHLHAAARTAAREKGYKHVWVKNGRIFMRKTDFSECKLVKDMDFLKSLTL